MTTRARTDSLLLAGFCAFLFLYGLGQFGLIGADEPRYAQAAREMLQRRDWVTPVLGGHPWLEKPPLYYWQAMIVYSMVGVSDWAARLPSALDAALLVVAMYLFLRRFLPGFELDGALITASSAGIVGYGRAASMDMALAAAFTIGMLGWWAWRENRKRIYLVIFYGCMALGMLAKGPVAPFLAAAVIILYAVSVRDMRLILKTLWLPGIFFFCALALPWYFAVQVRNPIFFHEFVIEQNLGRFSENLYHHTQPFWYYLPVTALALVPWTVFVIAAAVEPLREWWSRRALSAAAEGNHENHIGLFACSWLVVPIVFFSISQSKLPGYILPAIPAAGLLMAAYIQQRSGERKDQSVGKGLIVLHALLAGALIVPALLIAYLVAQHRLPGGQPMLVALAIAFVLCAGIALTLVRKAGLRMLRFTTLIPVVLMVGAVLKLGAATIDQTLSARPLALELASMEIHPMPLAVYHVRRELEFGLAFYRNQVILNYEWGNVPQREHIVVAAENSQVDIAKLAPGRRISFLGSYTAQHVDYYWVAAASPQPAD